ncbi:MAG: hypothetical protein HDT21_01405 [Ruminococcus sp.]|nr:hypothetical protein [Ruminococcus sp.]
MPSALELLGLDYPSMCELGGFFIAVISGSICLGLVLYDAFCAFIDLFSDIVILVFKFLRKRIIPNVRKKKH